MGMTLSRKGKIAVNVAFLAALSVPAVAVALSPGFVPFIGAMLAGGHSTKVETELLRRATPLWTGGADFYNRLLYNLGISPNPAQLMMGEDGYMFLGDANYMAYQQDLHRYDPPAADLDKWVDDLADEERHVADRGGRMFFVVAPSKGSIYFDKLGAVPPGFAATPTLFDRILDRARDRDLSIVDVRRDLIEARKTADTYSKLNSHWTDYGGYVAWQRIAATVGKAMPNLDLAGVNDLASVRTGNFGNEAAGLLSLDEPNAWTYPVRKDAFPTYYRIGADGKRTAVPGDVRTEFENVPVETFSPDAPNPQRVLVVTDSMGAALSPYFTASFRHVKQVVNHVRPPRDPPLDFTREVDGYKPDIVFYVMAERYFALPLRPGGRRL